MQQRASRAPRDGSMTKQPRAPSVEYRPRSAEAAVHTDYWMIRSRIRLELHVNNAPDVDVRCE